MSDVKRKPGRPKNPTPPVKTVETDTGERVQMLDVEREPPTTPTPTPTPVEGAVRVPGYQVWRSQNGTTVSVFYDARGRVEITVEAMGVLLLRAGYEHLRTVDDE
jgi:hypothetical protein